MCNYISSNNSKYNSYALIDICGDFTSNFSEHIPSITIYSYSALLILTSQTAFLKQTYKF